MVCADGLLIGTDTKMVAGDMKSPAVKLFSIPWRSEKMTPSENDPLAGHLIVAGAGAVRHIRDAVETLKAGNPSPTGEGAPFDEFLRDVVEQRLPLLCQQHMRSYGERPSYELLIGGLDHDGRPRMVEVYADGDYDYIDEFSAIGSGQIFGEILLRRLYHQDIRLEQALRLAAYIIWEVQTVDNASGEGMDIAFVGQGRSRRIGPHTPEVATFKMLPDIASRAYKSVRDTLERVPLNGVTEAVGNLHKAVHSPRKEARKRRRK